MNGNINVPTGEKNVIESVLVNGVKIDPVNKSINIPISIPAVPEYGEASETQSGLMSAADKVKLNGIAAGAQVNPTSLPANGGNSSTVNGHTVNSDVPANAIFTDTTYGLSTETNDGLMSKEDKEKLNGIPTGGLLAYTGTVGLGGETAGSFKITTAARPKFMMLYSSVHGNVNFSGENIRCYVTDGSYYIAGNDYANFSFKNDGVEFSWKSGTNAEGAEYVILC